MLKRIAFCGLLIGACVGGALAQNSPTPKPSPSPAQPGRGTHAFTEAAVQKLKRARAAYNDQCDTSTSLDVMNTAYEAGRSATFAAYNALRREIDTYPKVMAAKDKYNSLQNVYVSLANSQKDYEAELKAQSAAAKAWDAYESMYNKAVESLADALDVPELLRPPQFVPCPKHQALIDAKEKADQAATREANNKAAQKTATGTPKLADDCNKGGGLTGMMEGVACQEGKK